MAFVEALPIAEEALGAGAGAEGAGGGLGSMMKDFNDSPVAKIAGSVAGKLVHTVTGAIGTGGYGEERVNEGPVGHLA